MAAFKKNTKHNKEKALQKKIFLTFFHFCSDTASQLFFMYYYYHYLWPSILADEIHERFKLQKILIKKYITEDMKKIS